MQLSANQISSDARARARGRRKARAAGVPKTGRAGMLYYLKRHHPRLYAAIKVQYPEIVSGTGLGQTQESGGWADKILNVIQGALPIYQQQKIMETQLKLAKQGKPLLDVQQIQPAGIPIKVELPPGIEEEVRKTTATGRNVMGIAAIAGIGALALLFMGRRKGR